MPSFAPRRLAAALLAGAAALALAACDPRPADRPLKPTAPPVPAPSATPPPAAGG
ncbi:hypothetical protein [Pulveribacter sp.]|uniref:hypothetical protein n=1 Tax=Pulveribacter sp. TaxID=2678893 RepID=UPI0028A02E15|nr:hypothetical protein [Pulveribacter sp.]